MWEGYRDEGMPAGMGWGRGKERWRNECKRQISDGRCRPADTEAAKQTHWPSPLLGVFPLRCSPLLAATRHLHHIPALPILSEPHLANKISPTAPPNRSPNPAGGRGGNHSYVVLENFYSSIIFKPFPSAKFFSSYEALTFFLHVAQLLTFITALP